MDKGKIIPGIITVAALGCITALAIVGKWDPTVVVSTILGIVAGGSGAMVAARPKP